MFKLTDSLDFTGIELKCTAKKPFILKNAVIDGYVYFKTDETTHSYGTYYISYQIVDGYIHGDYFMEYRSFSEPQVVDNIIYNLTIGRYKVHVSATPTCKLTKKLGYFNMGNLVHHISNSGKIKFTGKYGFCDSGSANAFYILPYQEYIVVPIIMADVADKADASNLHK